MSGPQVRPQRINDPNPDGTTRTSTTDIASLDAGEELVQVVAAEGPRERLSDRVERLLERGEPVTDLIQVGEVVGVDDFASDDREVDFALVKPEGVDWQLPLDGALAQQPRAAAVPITRV